MIAVAVQIMKINKLWKTKFRNNNKYKQNKNIYYRTIDLT